MSRSASVPIASRTRPARLGLLAALGVIGASLVLAACGGSSSPSGRSSAATAADNALNFSKCMREHGVKNFPNPEVFSGGGVKLTYRNGGPDSAGSVSPQTMEAAQNACKHFQASEQQNITPQEKVQREEAVLKFAKCMREHGVDVHASTAGGGVQVRVQAGSASSGPNPESPAFQAAQKACQGLLPFKGGGPGGGPSPGTVKGGKGGKGGAGFAIGG